MSVAAWTTLGNDKEPIKVELVNPPYQDPWRTQGDYRRDQRRAARLYWFQILSIVAAMVGVVATTIVAITTIMAAAS